MNGLLAVYRKEVKYYFSSWMGYIIVLAFLVFMGFFFFNGVLSGGYADMRSFFGLLPFVFLFFGPAVAMRLVAEEKKLGSLEILLTLPIRDWEVIVGKFLAACTYLLFALLCTWPMPVTISYLGANDLGPIWSGYFGAYLLGCSFVAVGLFASSIVKDQVLAFILGVVFAFFLFVMGESFVNSYFPEGISFVLRKVSLGYHFSAMSRGVVDTRDLLYFLSMIVLFVYLSITMLMSRKW